MRFAPLFMVLWGVLWVAPAASAAERYAICIGVNDCPNFRLSDGARPRPLRGAESDAREMHAMLVDMFAYPQQQARLLLGAEATRQGIQKALEELSRRSRAEDSVVFYFAGHGTQLRDALPLDEEDGLDEALCCADAARDATGLLVDDALGRWLDDLKAASVTIVFDACHSGTGVKELPDDCAPRSLTLGATGRPLDRPEKPWQDLKSVTKSLTPHSRIALFACQPQQQAYERRFADQKAPARSGQFTRFLLEGLKQHRIAAEEPFMVRELAVFVQSRLDETFNSGRTDSADRQTPLLELTGDDRPLFAVPPRR